MAPPSVAEAREEFFNQFMAVCEKELSKEALEELGFVFHYTVRHAMQVGKKKWNNKARAYVLPKLAEFAARVHFSVQTQAGKGHVFSAADYVVFKYKGAGRVVWCKEYMAQREAMRAAEGSPDASGSGRPDDVLRLRGDEPS